ncbi:MAG: 4-hydroxythreonine-4-phosphate dehydrogenase PdxA [Dysgonamonadaceae bacterium]|jgi:4-hydroxythreonine-4-phosphate dehydrogenase|nr:4-hydroxythreonine-4-phosphate dehydrogenase PdxA [Dysgonamonadaceae bacterium]
MSDKIMKIGISHGDVNGVAYELILKTFCEPRMYENCIPVVYGSAKVVAYYRKMMDLPQFSVNNINHPNEAAPNKLNVISCETDDVTVELGRSTPLINKLAEQAFQRAVADLTAGHIDSLISAPSQVDERAAFDQLAGNGKKAINILIKDNLRIALATDRIPLSEVSASLSLEALVAQIRTLQSVLIHDFLIDFPRIAVLSLNPGAGLRENKFGREEEELIIPAVKEASKAGIVCFGPYSADDFFGNEYYDRFDAVLAMYHDQGCIPFRALSDNEGVCYSAGLSCTRIAPDTGVCYDKAGKNETSEAPFRNSVYLAADIFKNRLFDREINANPLKKEYYEKGSDNEKLDLTKDADSE